MTGSEPQQGPVVAKPPVRRGMAFRKSNRIALPTAEQSRRQATVVQSTWHHFGEPGPVIAFLNTRNALLGGQPLQLAIESDEGLGRVVALLERMTLEA